VVFVPKFTDDYEEKATLERVADHIDYIGQRCGRAHVGISSDFGKPLPTLIG
jgi:membrane dipeptidase